MKNMYASLNVLCCYNLVYSNSTTLSTLFSLLGNGPFTALSSTNHGTILQELCRTDKDFISVSEEVWI